MIVIINTGNNPSPIGTHEYRLQINNKLICTFTHERHEGLAECLRKAAKAVDHKGWMDVGRLLDEHT